MQPILFVPTLNIDAIKQIYATDGLYSTVQPDDVCTIEQWIPDINNVLWVTIIVDESIAGIIEIKSINPRLAELHIGLKKKYRGDLGLFIGIEGMKWIKNTLKFKHFITYVPIECKHVVTFIEKLGFHFSGVIHDGICYHHDIQSL